MIKFFIRGDWKVEIIYIEDSLETSITCLLNQDLRTYLVPPNRINSKQINKIFFYFYLKHNGMTEYKVRKSEI